jgi:hypothetical protein
MSTSKTEIDQVPNLTYEPHQLMHRITSFRRFKEMVEEKTCVSKLR